MEYSFYLLKYTINLLTLCKVSIMSCHMEQPNMTLEFSTYGLLNFHVFVLFWNCMFCQNLKTKIDWTVGILFPIYLGLCIKSVEMSSFKHLCCISSNTLRFFLYVDVYSDQLGLTEINMEAQKLLVGSILEWPAIHEHKIRSLSVELSKA